MKDRMLFVDDDSDLLQGLQRMLRSKRSEWDMTFVNGPKEALEMMQKTCFDVIVTDMRMPEIDGAQLLTEVKTLCPKSVRIILSGQAELSTIIKSIASTHQYLSKPCDPETLKVSIERATNLQKLMKSTQLAEFISQLDRLPSQPSLYSGVHEELKNEKPSIEKIGGLISCDVAMSAKVLQLVNSCFFGPKREIFNIQEAVGILGIELLRELALSHDIFVQTDSGYIGGLKIEQLNQHSIAVGNFAQRLAVMEGLERANAEICSTTGLLHDIGKVILALFAPDKYQEVMTLKEGRSRSLEKEIELFGTSHCEVGAYLLGLWGLPSAIVDASSYHYALNHREFSVLTALQVADLLASATDPLGRDHLENFIEVAPICTTLRK